jgi:hypothetical protein
LVVLESTGGRFLVTLNGAPVGSSDTLDFLPHRIQLRAGRLTASFGKLSIIETGQDSRMARLLQWAPVPGQRTLFQDRGKSGDKPRWPEDWDREASRFGRDTSRGVMVLEHKAETGVATALAAMPSPLMYAGVAVSARIARTSATPSAACSGIYARSRASITSENKRALLFACVNATHVRLLHFDPESDKWETLGQAALADPLAPAFELRLVLTRSAALLFLDGRLQVRGPRATRFGFDGAGLRVERKQVIEVSEFQVVEL